MVGPDPLGSNITRLGMGASIYLGLFRDSWHIHLEVDDVSFGYEVAVMIIISFKICRLNLL